MLAMSHHPTSYLEVTWVIPTSDTVGIFDSKSVTSCSGHVKGQAAFRGEPPPEEDRSLSLPFRGSRLHP